MNNLLEVLSGRDRNRESIVFIFGLNLTFTKNMDHPEFS